MKKTLLMGITLGFGFASIAQTTAQGTKAVKVDPAKNQAKVYNKKILTGDETEADVKPAHLRPANPVQGTFERASTEMIVGSTTYDLQTNSAMQDRIKNHEDGNISVVWTRSLTNDIGASDRGTGYVYFPSAGPAPTFPTARLEASRTGWPNIDKLASGKEVSIAHNTSLSQLTMMQNGGPGSTAWAQTDLTTGDQVWNRMGTGGPNGNSIHHVSLRAPSGLGGGIFGGVDGALLYYRSQDGGVTWDIQQQFIPGLDATNYTSMSGDSYTLQVRDSIVAVCYWGDMVPTIMAKSTDNGDTWKWTQLIDHGFKYDAGATNTDPNLGPIGISDADGDGIADTLDATDGAGAMIIDANGMVHVTYGNMSYLDDTPGDDSWSYFPGTNGLMYWNEGMGKNQPVMIGQALDLDNDGGIGGVSFSTGAWTGGEYFTSLSGIPHMAYDDNGCIYVSFSAYMETIDQGLQNYRHIYMTKSCDGGCSWTAQKDVTPLVASGGLGECVFGSLAKVDTDIHLVYQRDFEPGLAVRGDEDPFGTNEIVYVKIPTADLDTTFEFCYTFMDEPAYTALCPLDSVWLGGSCGLTYNWTSGETTDKINASIGVHSVSITNNCSVTDVHTITLTDATGAGTINFTLSSTETEICPGDTTWLSASTVSQAIYTWSHGQTGQTVVATDTIQYMVTITNCSGTGTDTIKVAAPALPVAVITGTATICNGDSTLLTAGLEPSSTYVWSNGDSTQTTYANSASTYTVTVSNCAGSDNASQAVAITAVPTASFTVSDNDFCEGTSTANLVAFGGTTYMWSDASTGQSLAVSTVAGSGTYYVIAYNACGDADTAASQTVTIFPLPATPTITVSTSGNNVVFTSSSADNDWFLNGGTTATASGATYTDSWTNLGGTSVTAVAVDANGCESVASSAVTPVPTGLEEIASNNVKLFPNPNSGSFTLTVENAGKYNVSIKNIIGQSIYNGMMNSSIMNFDLNNVDKGVYFITVKGENFETTERVIIK